MTMVNPGALNISDTTQIEQTMRRLKVLDDGVTGYITANSQYILLHAGAGVRLKKVSGVGTYDDPWIVGESIEEIKFDNTHVHLFIYKAGRPLFHTSQIRFRLQFNGEDITLTRYR